MSDTPTLVRFLSGWVQDGNGPDGLPMFKETIRVRMDRPPFLSLEREATEEDFAEHPQPYELFKKTVEARGATVGYPLVLWPACAPHLFQMCAARGVNTVEQLAQLASKKRRAESVKTLPPDILELADRAAKMVELHAKAGQYEELVTSLEGQIEALKEQVQEALTTITAQKTLIDTLRLKAAV